MVMTTPQAITADIEVDGVVRQPVLCWNHIMQRTQRKGVRLVALHVDDTPPGLDCQDCANAERAQEREKQRKAMLAAQLGVTAYGVKRFGDSDMDGGLMWLVIGHRVRTVDETLDIAEQMGFPVERCYAGPGRPFTDAATVFGRGSRTVVTQRFGWDI